MRRLAAVAALLLGAAGCDDPVDPAAGSFDFATDATERVDGRDDLPDARPDLRPDAAPDAVGDSAPADSTPDTALDDAAADSGDVGPLDAQLDGPIDSAADGGPDATPDAISDAAPDLAPDMPWASAAHQVFMTGESMTSDFGGVEGADAACAAAAAAAGLPGSWAAIISDAAAGARDRLVIVGPIETTAGERVAQGADDLWDGAIRTPIAVDARGLPPGGRPDVWTGTDADGRPDARANSFCSDWGRDDRPLGGVEIGRGDQIDARWVAVYRDGASAFNCGSQARLYCIDGQ